jgi:hypothetical protein
MTASTLRNTFLALACLATSSQAANIILVTDFEGTTDVPFVNHLTNAGHSVTATNQRYRTLDTIKIAELNAADLVIISRNTNSGDYATDAAEVASWDAITTTVWLGSGFIARNSRWNWVDSAATVAYNGDITAQNATAGAHPLYASLTPSVGAGFAGESKYLYTTGTEVAAGTNNLQGNGTGDWRAK